MKKIASILLLLLAFASCSEEITRNNPSLQGLKDDVMWRANDAQATVATGGRVTITGYTQDEILTLTVPFQNEITYNLGPGSPSTATYVLTNDGSELLYSTDHAMGDGQIVITDYDTENRTVTGTFRFNAINVENNPDGAQILNYHEGIFYKIPVVPDL